MVVARLRATPGRWRGKKLAGQLPLRLADRQGRVGVEVVAAAGGQVRAVGPQAKAPRVRCSKAAGARPVDQAEAEREVVAEVDGWPEAVKEQARPRKRALRLVLAAVAGVVALAGARLEHLRKRRRQDRPPAEVAEAVAAVEPARKPKLRRAQERRPRQARELLRRWLRARWYPSAQPPASRRLTSRRKCRSSPLCSGQQL